MQAAWNRMRHGTRSFSYMKTAKQIIFVAVMISRALRSHHACIFLIRTASTLTQNSLNSSQNLERSASIRSKLPSSGATAPNAIYCAMKSGRADTSLHSCVVKASSPLRTSTDTVLPPLACTKQSQLASSCSHSGAFAQDSMYHQPRTAAAFLYGCLLHEY
jgi:hypothetical protein